MTVGGRRVDHRDRVVVLVSDIDGMGRVIDCDRERGLSDRDRRRRLTATTRVASVAIATVDDRDAVVGLVRHVDRSLYDF